MNDWKPILDELVRQRDRLFRRANVVGCGVGLKEKEGKITGEQAIVVFVQQKLPLRQLRRRDRIPERFGTCRTDVVEVGELRALSGGPQRTQRIRPARPGSSISHFKVTAGTFGAVVYDRDSGEPLILSNNHVLANTSTVATPRAQVGDPVFQPGTYDGGTARDVIARLLRFVPLVTDEHTPRGKCVNLVDAAVARPLAPCLVDPDILRIGPVTGTAEAYPGMRIKKSGRTTGLNTGTVRAVAATLDISMGDAGIARFEDQIVTTPMAEPGDSGSAVLDSSNRIVGLLFAGSASVTICNRAIHVADALRIEFTKAGMRKRPEVDSGSRNEGARGGRPSAAVITRWPPHAARLRS